MKKKDFKDRVRMSINSNNRIIARRARGIWRRGMAGDILGGNKKGTRTRFARGMGIWGMGVGATCERKQNIARRLTQINADFDLGNCERDGSLAGEKVWLKQKGTRMTQKTRIGTEKNLGICEWDGSCMARNKTAGLRGLRGFFNLGTCEWKQNMARGLTRTDADFGLGNFTGEKIKPRISRIGTEKNFGVCERGGGLAGGRGGKMNGMNRIFFGFVFLVFVFAFLSFGFAGGDEAGQLESDLIDAGYDWLINYSVEYPSVEVYHENENVSIGEFNIFGGDLHKIYPDFEYSDDAFDLFMIGNEIPQEILLKKVRIDELKQEMNEYG